MNAEKIRNLTDAELAHQQRELADQLFKLKFQLKMGQTESLKKIRDLKKDIARIKTIEREKQMAGGNGAVAVKAAAPVVKPVKAKKAAGKAKAKGGQEEDGCNGEEVSHGRDNDSNNRKSRRTPQDADRRSGLHQDGQDHRGGGATARRRTRSTSAW